ncbi:MAG: pyridoxal phosphate-dependent aminotransferase [Alphaproteobacteria bacterium]|nr:MAG: pyridoxal phosphate-dependent aminotransferase [Alphaproteobacteria bacterium]
MNNSSNCDNTSNSSEAFLGALRPEARSLPESGIVAAMNYGMGREGLIPLWTGEGDVATPDFICAEADRSMRAGETFYTRQRGIPELREALARYHGRHYARPFPAERFFITGSGMQAVQIAMQAIAGPGDEVVIPTPAWPNYAATAHISGTRAVEVPMDFTPEGWVLDIERLKAACSAKTRAIFINSPANPTGWTADRDTLAEILDFARARGIWVIADEVYGRFYFGGEGDARAPSFLDIAGEGDRLLVVNTFSKNWAMTGWRIGWLYAPEALGSTIENLIQYNTSGVAVFMQRAAVVALEQGEAFAQAQVSRARAGRDLVCERLAPLNRVRFARPEGAFYLLFAIEGVEDSQALAFRLIDEANIGLAPGTAFGAGGESFLRLCFARSAEGLEEAMDRLTRWVKNN